MQVSIAVFRYVSRAVANRRKQVENAEMEVFRVDDISQFINNLRLLFNLLIS